MVPSKSLPRFTIPIDDAQPKGAARFELWAPKLKRRITLFFGASAARWIGDLPEELRRARVNWRTIQSRHSAVAAG